MSSQELQNKIEEAALFIGKSYPLYSFVTANQLSGYEDLPFFDALEQGGNLWGARVLPAPHVFYQAWNEGLIDREIVKKKLLEAGIQDEPEQSLSKMDSLQVLSYINEYQELDRLTIKWVSLFMDEGMAHWNMPFKEMGFYMAWRLLVVYDDEIRKSLDPPLPKTPEEALNIVLEGFNEQEQKEIFKRHLAALPGWAGYIKYRVENKSIWNEDYPITLMEYMAVRLWMAKAIHLPILPKPVPQKDHEHLRLKYIWLQAWEQTWQKDFFAKLKMSHEQPVAPKFERPDAQLVFCLDSRSELLRRGLERIGNYETFGSAGAFGLPMNYRNPETGLINKSSPAMLPSHYLVHEEAAKDRTMEIETFEAEGKRIKSYKYFMGRLKNVLPSAFGYVEGAGLYYGIMMLLRIFKPNEAEKIRLHHKKGYEQIYEPHICSLENESLDEIPIEEKAKLVKGVFDSCGWRNFAPLVVFIGHASHSTNNPYASSLDCGACAGNPGKRNARTLARLANTPEVRRFLKDYFELEIPEDTLFLAGEHITSSDEVKLFDERVPESHQKALKELKENLRKVKAEMVKERLGEAQKAVEMAKIKSNSWSETRPEWGLSGHAGYLIGPRSLTQNGKFSDCFLSSYDWHIDRDGTILKGILLGPLLVCQWISDHYYFSTVDNEVFGGGSKITLNVTGKFGAMQGNGSDLKIGLPQQSLMLSDEDVYHKPIRLTTLIQAPRRFVEQAIENDEKLKSLVHNDWLYIFIMDPEKENEIEGY